MNRSVLMILQVAFASLFVFSVAVLGQDSLPLLPDEFYATLEVSFVEANTTISVEEFYDPSNNRMRISHRLSGGGFSTHIYMFGTDRQYAIDNGSCVVHNITADILNGDGRIARFIDPTSRHLRSARDVYEFVKFFNYTYEGQKTARGIMCDVWTTNASVIHHGHQMNISVEWYFAVPSWFYHFSDSTYRTPIRSIFSGTAKNISDGSPPRAFFHEHEWLAFVPSQPDPTVFGIPFRTICRDLVNKPLPDVPYNFQVTVSVETLNSEFVIREFVDYDKNLARIESYVNDSLVIDIYNFQEMIRYSLVGPVNGQHEPVDPGELIDGDSFYFGYTCNRNAILPNDSFLQPGTHHVFHPTYEFDQSHFFYSGNRTVGNIETEVWSADISTDTINMTAEWDISFNTDVFGTHSEGRAPVRLYMEGITKLPGSDQWTPFTQQNDYHGIIRGPVPLSFFKLPSQCGQQSKSDSVITKGEVAAVGLGMFVVGILGGGIAAYCFIRKRSFKRMTDENTMELDQ